MANAFSLYTALPALQCRQRGNLQHLHILVSTCCTCWIVVFLSVPLSAVGLLVWLHAVVSQNHSDHYRESLRKDDVILTSLFQAVLRLGVHF